MLDGTEARGAEVARNAAVAPGDGWLGLDHEDNWAAVLFSRWPVLNDDVVRAPPEVPARRRDPS